MEQEYRDQREWEQEDSKHKNMRIEDRGHKNRVTENMRTVNRKKAIVEHETGIGQGEKLEKEG